METERLAYTCTNDACPSQGEVWWVGSEADVTCPECGWMMSALYD